MHHRLFQHVVIELHFFSEKVLNSNKNKKLMSKTKENIGLITVIIFSTEERQHLSGH